ncbi:MAG: class I SAM-dependent methyltransferase [Pyrinomonadaceae bacterium]
MNNFENKLETLDISLFEKIHSQTSNDDKRSILACQKAVRELIGSYKFLEIGSYRGGSLQPFVSDEKCEKIISIDKRPKVSPDERGIDVVYLDNTTEKMLENLRGVFPEGISKIRTIDGDVSDIDPEQVSEKPELCFIDGEHTDEATYRDFQFCHKVMANEGAVLFHDTMIIYNAVSRIIEYLKENKIKFRAYNLPSVMFVIEIGDFPLYKSKAINEMLSNNYVGYLEALKFSDQYRQFANRPLFRFARNLKAKITGSNITK